MSSSLNPTQRRSLERIVAGLHSLGFGSDLIRKEYRFDDWFEDGVPERKAEATAFARKPFAYDTACFAITASNGIAGTDLIKLVRAIGAPRAFEIAKDGRVFHWRVSESPR